MMSETAEANNCHKGGSNGILAGIMMGEKNGIMDDQTAKALSGCEMMVTMMIMAMMMGKVTG